PTTFGPFNLVLNFSFKGLDTKDLKLYKQKIRNILYQREPYYVWHSDAPGKKYAVRSEEHTSELQSRFDLVCRLLLEKKNKDMREIQLIINHKDLTGIDKVCNDIEGIV